MPDKNLLEEINNCIIKLNFEISETRRNYGILRGTPTKFQVRYDIIEKSNSIRVSFKYFGKDPEGRNQLRSLIKTGIPQLPSNRDFTGLTIEPGEGQITSYCIFIPIDTDIKRTAEATAKSMQVFFITFLPIANEITSINKAPRKNF
jgi:hypothetical protein